MSTGSGPGGARGSRTDPRPRDSQRSRGLHYRSNLSDEQVNATGLEDRPNNWDFSEWRPSDVFDNKRIKKENPEKERDKAKEKSLKQDSPPDGSRRKHTPSTYPRTRVSATTPVADRRSLERLRQQLQFSDQDEASQTGSERNNERPPSSYERQLNFTDQLTGMQAAIAGKGPAPTNGSLLRHAQEGVRREEQNNIRPQGAQAQSSQMPDSNQLVGRLMQVRDYIKQAMQMMDRLRAMPPTDQDARTKTRKLAQVIEQLREQEQNYMDFLMKVLSNEEAALLDGESSKDETEEAGDDTTSVDMDAQSEISEATTEASITVGAGRPPIESHLGFYPSIDENRAPSCLSDGDFNAIAEIRKRRNEKGSNQLGQDSGFLESKNRELEQLSEDQRRIHDIIAGEAQSAMNEKQDELDQLRKQRDLLKNMLQQQRQLRDLQGRQVALLQQQRDSHRELTEGADEEDSETGAAGEGDQDTQSVDSDILARQLSDLKAQLDYAKNMYTNEPDKSAESKSRDDEEESSDSASEASIEQQKNELLDKLRHLQNEKNRMDDLLGELKTMRDSKFTQLNNELDSVTPEPSPSPASNSATRDRAHFALESADGTIMDANQVLDMLDAQTKVKKLEEVRNRLTQLKDLVQYYDSGTRFIHDEDGDEDETEMPPPMPDLSAMRDDLEVHREALNQLKASTSLEPPQSIARRQTSEDDASEINFSLGPFENDPEILAQVNKLKTAKQRLKRLKDMVENMPSMDDATAMVEEFNQLNASLGVTEQFSTDDRAAQDEEASEAEYQVKVEEQKQELRNLMQERQKLVGVQDQLRNLYQNLPPGQRPTPPEAGDSATRAGPAPNLASSTRKKEARKMVQRESVTFQDPPEVASNEEVYNRMRSQRILREELRSRKRELEAIMRKGDLRKPYSRLNQDNQSDNISYSNKSDSYGFGNLSADVTTMATWGGSTEQNLEEMKNSTHSNSTSTSDNDDDGYPSDGILQVEEEEEEADSDANTYTVEDEEEDDEMLGKTNVQPPIIDVKAQQKVSLPDSSKNELRFKPRYNAWASDTYPKVSVQRNKRQRKDQLRQENYRSPEDLVSDRDEQQSLRGLQRKLDLTTQMCHTLMRDQQALNQLYRQGVTTPQYHPNALATPMATPTQATSDPMAAYTQQLIQQQMQLGLQQCQQLIYQQQMEIRNLNSQFMALSTHDEFHLQPQFLQGNFAPISPSPLIALGGVKWPEEEGRKERKEEKRDVKGKKTSPPKQEVPKLKLDDIRKRSEARRNESAVVGRKYPSGDRATAAASLASKITPKSKRSAHKPGSAPAEPRPGLSGMISGTSFLDQYSQSSQVSSLRGDSAPTSPDKRKRDTRDSDGAVGLSLFEALRENIYSEVASLISQNEGRPHYLIELFRELQLLTSDYLRQRALYALKDLISTTLSQDDPDEEDEDEEEESSVRSPAPLWMSGNVQATSEQTPSESLMTSEDEVSPTKQTKTSGQKPSSRQHEVTAQIHSSRSGRPEEEPCYDYMETVENMSSLSTPPSTGAWDGPFAQDSLGDTVIHLDKAMARMREYERKLTEGLAASGNDTSPLFRRQSSGTQTEEKGSSSSAVDPGNESSESDVQPHIDTRQLDAKIKSIMTQVIPILKTHMEDTCNAELLSYMKTVILALAHQRGDDHDHTQFFHKQLARLVQDTLTKYEGRKMVECVEDLVVDISEILFSELAFYHLMRGLDDPKLKAARARAERNASMTSSDMDTLSDVPRDRSTSAPGTSGRKALIEYESTSEEGDEDERDEQMEKDRDDEMAAAVNIENDSDDQIDQDETVLQQTGPYSASIQLAPSETKPFNRIGSDEDDEGSDDDDSISDKDGFDTAVSRDAEKEADSSRETLRAEDTEHEGTLEYNGLAAEDYGETDEERGEQILTLEDIPVKLDLNQEELLMKQAMDEAQRNSALQAAMTMTDSGDGELAGDSSAIPEPAGNE